jgi:hypothetical protein
MCTYFLDFNAVILRVSLNPSFSPTPMEVPNGIYRHLNGTDLDPRCGAMFDGARYLFDHAPLTCVDFRLHSSPRFRHFCAVAGYRFCLPTGFFAVAAATLERKSEPRWFISSPV